MFKVGQIVRINPDEIESNGTMFGIGSSSIISALKHNVIITDKKDGGSSDTIYSIRIKGHGTFGVYQSHLLPIEEELEAIQSKSVKY